MRVLLRFVVGVVALTAFSLAAGATAAMAQGEAPAAVFTLGDAAIVTFITGTLLPILVGVVVKLRAAAWIKAWLHGALSAIAGAFIVATQLDGTAVFSRDTLLAAFIVWITGIAVYHGFLVPSKISPAINAKTAGIGIG